MGRQSNKLKPKLRLTLCRTCVTRHTGPTGEKCTRKPEIDRQHDDVPDSPSPPPSDTDDALSLDQTERQSEGGTSGSSRSDTELILQKLSEFKAEAAAQRKADKTEMQTAIEALSARIDAPTLLSEDEEPVKSTPGRPRGQVTRPQPMFARPARQHTAALFGQRVTVLNI